MNTTKLGNNCSSKTNRYSSSLRKTFIAAIAFSFLGTTTASANVVLADFAAHANFKKNQVELKWNTVSEENNWAFTILRSEDAEQWRNIGTVNGQGNSDRPRSYRFVDAAPPKYGAYYKIEWQEEHGPMHSMPAFVTFGAEQQGEGGIQSRNVTSVELSDFIVDDDIRRVAVDMKWVTQAEQNNEGFSVQRSMDGEEFTQIGYVEGAEHSDAPKFYYFTEQESPFGGAYYRLEYVHEGVITHSPVAFVQMGEGVEYDNQGVGTRSGSFVEIADFRARGDIRNGTAHIKWMTLEERNNAGFHVQRSVDQDVWTEIAFIPGAAHSNEILDYHHADDNAPRSGAYYRLEYVSDGLVVHTAPQYVPMGSPDVDKGVGVSIKSSETSRVYRTYPNPASRNIRISGNETFNVNGKIRVISADGKRYKVDAKSYGKEIELDLNDIPEGIYVVQLEDGFARFQKK